MKFILLFAMTCGPVLAQIVPIQGTDTVAGSRTTINNNFSYLDVKTTGIDCSSGTCTFTKMGIPTTTVAALPAAASNTGVVYFVTDSASTSSCATGGGANILMCRSNGSSWLVVSGGGGGSGPATTTDLPEGTNLYHTTARARAAIAAAGTCGVYSNSTGIIDFSGCADISHGHNGSAINAGVVSATFGGLGVNAGSFAGILKISGGIASVVTGTAGHCVHVDGTSSACATGTGNVVNNGTSTTKAIPRFVGAGGTELENTSVLISDAGQITAPGGFVSGDGSQAGEVRLTELGANGTDYLSFLGQGSRATTLRLRWPSTDPTAGQVPLFGAPSSNISDVSWVDANGHNHAASQINSGTLAAARGGLAADTSALTGVVKIASGVGSVVTGTGSNCVHVDGTSGSCGAGSMSGPGSATDNAITRFDGTTGALTQNSTAIVTDGGQGQFPGGVVSTIGTEAGVLNLLEKAANGDNFFRIQSPDSRDTDVILIMPTADPVTGQYMTCPTPNGTTHVSICVWATPGAGTGDALRGSANTWTAGNDFSGATVKLPSTTAASATTTAGNITYQTDTTFGCIGDGTNCKQLLTAGGVQDVGSKNLLSNNTFIDTTDASKTLAFDLTNQATGGNTVIKPYGSGTRNILIPPDSFVIPHKLTCTMGESSELANSAASTVNFGKTCTIPNAWLVTNRVIKVHASFDITTPNPNTGEQITLCLIAGASTQLYCTAAKILTAGLTHRGAYGYWLLEGRAASGASAQVNIGGMVHLPGLAVVDTANQLGIWSVNLPTNADLDLSVTVQWTTTTSGNMKARLVQFVAMSDN